AWKCFWLATRSRRPSSGCAARSNSWSRVPSAILNPSTAERNLPSAVGGTPRSLVTKANPFFFQAEDGIRDKLVTGVQTCALPICHHSISHHQNRQANLDKIRAINIYHMEQLAYLTSKLKSVHEGDATLLDNCMVAYGRSEERRVGKECRWRWGACR